MRFGRHVHYKVGVVQTSRARPSGASPEMLALQQDWQRTRAMLLRKTKGKADAIISWGAGPAVARQQIDAIKQKYGLSGELDGLSDSLLPLLALGVIGYFVFKKVG